MKKIIKASEIGKEYSRKFDNLDSLGHVSILFDPRFGNLMQTAITRNRPLTRDEVEAEFGPLAWEW